MIWKLNKSDFSFHNIKKTFTITTKFGVVKNIPVIEWNELQPYWSSIVHAILDVITENKFRPFTANEGYPEGIVASTGYWKYYGGEQFHFSEALRFLELLKMKEEFRIAIRSFNENYVDWLDSKNVGLLGSRVYGFYYTLKPVLTTRRDEHGTWLAVRYKESH